ncbi:uncharacterized protein BT62DRAFT_1010742 [Guyanagaster necrorhizus]|uniref:Uncharacterized protein n=1 Tax=Guyanagaster necrorhizus TaxID=856835 RepID=A0A9P8ANR5_9AGAR|nr:uncharacterized protein BT62DRAFT_1010742 [Guyanagaster necrorhizus MCA 3950]KAG7442205.1 hypothetical protein BT62DRAFT_1010742 [Guyanagaster necrorhizus MCA 3950]
MSRSPIRMLAKGSALAAALDATDVALAASDRSGLFSVSVAGGAKNSNAYRGYGGRDGGKHDHPHLGFNEQSGRSGAGRKAETTFKKRLPAGVVQSP